MDWLTVVGGLGLLTLSLALVIRREWRRRAVLWPRAGENEREWGQHDPDTNCEIASNYREAQEVDLAYARLIRTTILFAALLLILSVLF